MPVILRERSCYLLNNFLLNDKKGRVMKLEKGTK
jgi:hypothetical protein